MNSEILKQTPLYECAIKKWMKGRFDKMSTNHHGSWMPTDGASESLSEKGKTKCWNTSKVRLWVVSKLKESRLPPPSQLSEEALLNFQDMKEFSPSGAGRWPLCLTGPWQYHPILEPYVVSKHSSIKWIHIVQRNLRFISALQIHSRKEQKEKPVSSHLNHCNLPPVPSHINFVW